jgi:hypothetical protein
VVFGRTLGGLEGEGAGAVGGALDVALALFMRSLTQAERVNLG